MVKVKQKNMPIIFSLHIIQFMIVHHHNSIIGGGMGGAMGPPDFRVLHRILVFCNRNIIWSVNKI